MKDALRIIAAKSPSAASEAIKAMQAIDAKSPVVQLRYNKVAKVAFGDPQADFTPDERILIAGYLDSDDSPVRSADVRMRVTPAEKERLQTAAQERRIAVSDLLRAGVEEYLRPTSA